MWKLKIWDLPIRVFHWTLVILMAICLYTAYNFYDIYDLKFLGLSNISAMKAHQYAGVGILILMIFRIVWGFVGSSYARFWNFLRSPKSIINYIKTGISPTEGHNPMGGYMVLLFIIVILLQVTVGLFLEDNTYMFKNAPLASYISGETRSIFKLIHYYGHYVIFGLIALHLLAIIFYAVVKHQDLVITMITGNRSYNKAHSESPKSLKYNHPLIGIILLFAIAISTIYLLYY